ncbi:GDSL-like Lipase/Acylhydrolase family protein [Collimonas arenae]|uniref:GDSL-like Lipase/Acylhydrolase family protein n=1 Tax=Collimonas arenae TaxID=279058 RepID=A0A127QQB0_9BURK|nr:SGNH/GDSL hydrolase family protein [Collimonas arenae]AMP02325.1 GDSL-like Lipase/Acylhydrolase family protein [Collimonas arenae]AMP12221.1 GDSL-like Lipase/Acylhydrolase family protein [Collimonas arenae]
MRRWLPELIALPLLPWLIVQGRRARRVTPRLPEAMGPTIGQARIVADAGETPQRPLALLTIGESPVAGVGVATHYEAITGQFAAALAARLQRTITWQAVGQNGATISMAVKTMLPQVASQKVDIVLIAFGVNDTTSFRSCRRYRAELLQLMRDLQAHVSPRLMVISGIPPIHAFPALPEPLRYVLGMKAKALDETVEHLISNLPVDLRSVRVTRVPMLIDINDRDLMASDGYHPSASGVALWARQLATAVAAHLKSIKKSKAAQNAASKQG